MHLILNVLAAAADDDELLLVETSSSRRSMIGLEIITTLQLWIEKQVETPMI